MSRPRLLAYRALGLGDLLTGVPALRALRRAFPEHELTLATPRTLAPLAELSGAVDAVLDVRALEPLPAGVHGADVAVNLHGRGPQSHAVLRAAAPRRLIAFALGEEAGPRWRPGEHEVARWCRLLRESGIPADATALDLPRPPWPAPPAARGATLLHPGAASPARRWPAERWAEVARAERAAGRPVAITGAANERPVALRIAAAAGVEPERVLAGSTDVRGLAAAVAAAGRVICGDTGVAHLATAFGTPSVVLFGPVPPAEWGPPPDRERHRALWAGRRGDPHGDVCDPGLLEIRPDAAVRALAALV